MPKVDCNICGKQFNSLYLLKRHHQNIYVCEKKTDKTHTYQCNICNYKFKLIQNYNRHNKNKTCIYKMNNNNNNNNTTNDKLINIIIEKNNKIEELNNKTLQLEKNIKIEKLNNKTLQLEKNIKIEELNNKTLQLEKNKIEELNNKTLQLEKNKIEELNNKTLQLENINNNTKQLSSLILNNLNIQSRLKDNYINANQICKAGNKKFKLWYNLETTKELIKELESDKSTVLSQQYNILNNEYKFIDNKNSNNLIQGYWVHPYLAIQLAHWISPNFALQISNWILTLFSNNKMELNINLLNDKDNIIKIKNQRIKLLENTYLKKHQRIKYSEKYIIYMLTTEENKKKRNYIIGKTINLTNRLSTYNKSIEHEVVYYKSCKNEETMNIIESMILTKLKDYKECANRDRFILPLEKDISFFTNIIDNSINFFNNL